VLDTAQVEAKEVKLVERRLDGPSDHLDATRHAARPRNDQVDVLRRDPGLPGDVGQHFGPG
jgi:hypothetical protein